MNELLPCPGGKDHTSTLEEDINMSGRGRFWVYCSCGWVGPVRREPDEAIAAWNTRADIEQWQPIETAPRDGTRVLAYWPDVFENASASQVESWFEDAVWQSAFETGEGYNDPTHWIPLPTPPETET